MAYIIYDHYTNCYSDKFRTVEDAKKVVSEWIQHDIYACEPYSNYDIFDENRSCPIVRVKQYNVPRWTIANIKRAINRWQGLTYQSEFTAERINGYYKVLQERQATV